MADTRFLGTGAGFPLQIDPATGRFRTVSGDKSVKESIYIILMTQTTERLVRPEFGSDLMSYTFMDPGTTMLSILRRDITETILNQEPRVSDVEIDTEYRESQGAVIINIAYRVSETNTRDNLVFPFYLDRADESEQEAEETGPLDREYYDDENFDEMMEEDRN